MAYYSLAKVNESRGLPLWRRIQNMIVGPSPYKCGYPNCDRFFSTPEKLEYHIRSKHPWYSSYRLNGWLGIAHPNFQANLGRFTLNMVAARGLSLNPTDPSVLFMIDDSLLLEHPSQSLGMYSHFKEKLCCCAEALLRDVPWIEICFVRLAANFRLSNGEWGKSKPNVCTSIASLSRNLDNIYNGILANPPEVVQYQSVLLRLDELLHKICPENTQLPSVAIFTDRIPDSRSSTLDSLVLREGKPLSSLASELRVAAVSFLQVVILGNDDDIANWFHATRLQSESWRNNVGIWYVEWGYSKPNMQTRDATDKEKSSHFGIGDFGASQGASANTEDSDWAFRISDSEDEKERQHRCAKSHVRFTNAHESLRLDTGLSLQVSDNLKQAETNTRLIKARKLPKSNGRNQKISQTSDNPDDGKVPEIRGMDVLDDITESKGGLQLHIQTNEHLQPGTGEDVIQLQHNGEWDNTPILGIRPFGSPEASFPKDHPRHEVPKYQIRDDDEESPESNQHICSPLQDFGPSLFSLSIGKAYEQADVRHMTEKLSKILSNPKLLAAFRGMPQDIRSRDSLQPFNEVFLRYLSNGYQGMAKSSFDIFSSVAADASSKGLSLSEYENLLDQANTANDWDRQLWVSNHAARDAASGSDEHHGSSTPSLDETSSSPLEDEAFENLCEDVKDLVLQCKLRLASEANKREESSTEKDDTNSIRLATSGEGHEDDVSSSTSALGDTGAASIIEPLVKVCRAILRRLFDAIHPIPLGKQRVRWACECGEPLVADFDDGLVSSLDPTILQQSRLLDFSIEEITGPPAIYQTAASNASDSEHARSTSLSSSSSSHEHSESPSDESSSSGYTNDTSRSLYTNQNDSTSSTSSANNCPNDTSFLELCVNQGENVISLSEIHLSRMNNDGDLFTSIRQVYRQLRGFRRWFFLLKPANIHYVKLFCVEERHLVGILDVPSYPTQEAMKKKRYHYEKPCMPKEVFLHYLTSRKTHKQRTWLHRLPRKLKTSIHLTALPHCHLTSPQALQVETVTEGWGIRIVEGPDRAAIFWSTVFITAMTLTISLAYLGASGDVQGASGIGAFIAALWAILMPAFYFKWSVT